MGKSRAKIREIFGFSATIRSGLSRSALLILFHLADRLFCVFFRLADRLFSFGHRRSARRYKADRSGRSARSIGLADRPIKSPTDDAVPDQITYINEVRGFDDQRRALATDGTEPAAELDPAWAARRRHADMTNISSMKLFSLIVDDESD